MAQFGGRRTFRIGVLAIVFVGLATSARSQLAETGDLLVADAGADTVFVVDVNTGDQSVLASGAPLSDPSGIAVDSTTGLIYVSDRSAGPGGIGALIEIDPLDGSMRVASSGDQLAMSEDVVVNGSSGQIAVIDGLSGLVVIDPDSGDQTIISDQTGSGITRLALFGAPRSADAIAIDPGPLELRRILTNGDTLLVGQAGSFQVPTGITTRGPLADFAMVADAGNPSLGDGQVIEVRITNFSEANPEANQRVVASGVHLVDPLDLETDPAGVFLYVIDPGAAAGAGAVIRVDSDTGDQVLLSSGDLFVDPTAIELFPVVNSDRIFAPLYVADSSAAEILLVDRVTGEQTVVATGDLLVEPSAVLAVPGSTDLFVADRRAAAAGAVIHVDADSGLQTPVASGGNLGNPEALVRLPGGDLLVADALGPGLIRVDPTTGNQSVIAGVPPTLVGVAVTGDGEVYGLQALPPTVVRIDLAGGGTDTVGSGVDLGSPVDLVAEASGSLIVLDSGGSIIRLDPDAYDNGSPSANQVVLSTGGEFVAPTGIGVAPDGSFFVTDPSAASGAGALLRVSPFGGAQPVVSMGGLFVNPAAVASGRAIPGPGDILVADALQDAIVLIDPDTGDQRVVTQFGLLSFPDGIAIDLDGSLLVAEANNNLLLRVDLETGAQTVVASGPDLPDPRAVAVRGDGAIFVGSRVAPFPVARVDPATGGTMVIASNSPGETRFNGMQKLVVDPDSGDLFVSTNVVGFNVSGDALLRLDPDTLPLPAMPDTILDGEPLESANEMVVDPDTGDIFVANNLDILRVDPVTGDATIVSEGGLFDRVAGLAMEADGMLVGATVFGDSVVRVDPQTGAQELVSYSNVLRQPQGIAVVPAPEPGAVVLAGIALAVVAALGGRRRPAGAAGRTVCARRQR